MKYLSFILIFLTSCTFSINMVHTQGEAENVVDENQSAQPDIKTDLDIPF